MKKTVKNMMTGMTLHILHSNSWCMLSYKIKKKKRSATIEGKLNQWDNYNSERNCITLNYFFVICYWTIGKDFIYSLHIKLSYIDNYTCNYQGT